MDNLFKSLSCWFFCVNLKSKMVGQILVHLKSKMVGQILVHLKSKMVGQILVHHCTFYVILLKVALNHNPPPPILFVVSQIVYCWLPVLGIPIKFSNIHYLILKYNIPIINIKLTDLNSYYCSINLMTVMGSITTIARQRPEYFSKVVQAFEALQGNV